jgi:uncharacterized protein YbgA (DUF1722 family)
MKSQLSNIRTIGILNKLLQLLEKQDGLYIKHIGVIEGILLANKFIEYGQPIKYITIKYSEPKYIYFGPMVAKERKESYDEYIIRHAKQYIHSILN